MKNAIALILGASILILAGCATAPHMTKTDSGATSLNAPTPDTLLDHLAGKWILTGTIGDKATTHDVKVKWVLNREYLQFREISRERNKKGGREYEAIVLFSCDKQSGEYSCLWLDTTSNAGLTNGLIGHAKPDGDTIPFVFKPGDGNNFHNTMIYDKDTRTWQWKMDGEENGKLQPFARLTLKRK